MTEQSKKDENERIESTKMDLRANDLTELEIQKVLDIGLCFNPRTKKWDGGWIESKQIRYFINSKGILTLPLGDLYSFNAEKTGLTSLHNMPETVKTDFNVRHNNIVNIDDAPTYVGGILDVSHNKIKTLEPLNSTLKVKSFICNNNDLTDMQGCPGAIKEINCSDNPLVSLKGLPMPEQPSAGMPMPELFNLISTKTRLKNYAHITTTTFNISSLYKISGAERSFVRKLNITNTKDQTKVISNYDSSMSETEYYTELASFMAKANLIEEADEIWWHEDVRPNIQNLFGSFKTINKFSL